MRITASIFAFLRKVGFMQKSETKFRMFSVNMEGATIDVKTPKFREEKLDKYFNEEKSESGENETI